MNVAEQRRLALILGTVMALGPAAVNMYLPALPALAQSLSAGLSSAQMTVSTYFVGLAIGQLLYGPLADRIGRKPPMLAGLLLFTLSSVGCALASSVEMLIGLRFVQAIGSSCGTVITLAIVRDCFPPAGVARMLSRLMLVMGVAPILAPLAGGQLLVWLGWRSIFWVLALAGAACFVSILIQLKETRPAHSVGPASVRATLAGFAAVLANRRFLGYALARAGSYAGLFAFITGSPFVFITLYGVAPEHFGWLFGATSLAMIIASQLNVLLLRRYSSEQVLRATLAVTLVSGFVLAAVATYAGRNSALGLIPLLIPLLAYMATPGLVHPNAASQAMAPFGERAGTASSVFGSLSFVVAALASSAVSVFHDGTALPMAGTIAVAGLFAFCAYHLLAKPRGHAAAEARSAGD